MARPGDGRLTAGALRVQIPSNATTNENGVRTKSQTRYTMLAGDEP